MPPPDSIANRHSEQARLAWHLGAALLGPLLPGRRPHPPRRSPLRLRFPPRGPRQRANLAA